jgi:hypothetical protein
MKEELRRFGTWVTEKQHKFLSHHPEKSGSELVREALKKVYNI